MFTRAGPGSQYRLHYKPFKAVPGSDRYDKEYGTYGADKDNQYTLFSYDMPIAQRIERGTMKYVFLTSQKAPSVTTAKQMHYAHSVCRGASGFAYFPLEKLRQYNIPDLFSVSFLEVDPVTYLNERMFWGETLFSYRGRVYLAGQDRDEPKLFHEMFLTQFPKGAEVKTIAQAIEYLRPTTIVPGYPRRGKWFFEPCPGQRFHERDVWKDFKGESTVPIFTESGSDQGFLLHTHSGYNARQDHWSASRMALDKNAMYVSGVIRRPGRMSLTLPDPKMWYQVLRNRSATTQE